MLALQLELPIPPVLVSALLLQEQPVPVMGLELRLDVGSDRRNQWILVYLSSVLLQWVPIELQELVFLLASLVLNSAFLQQKERLRVWVLALPLETG
jgi:hypothetical protein